MKFSPTETGLYDLGGNVWEWCEDKFSASSTDRVLRGGSWINDASGFLLSSERYHGQPSSRVHGGFRVVVVSGR
jgi:formylglycine-generating enzyme required for sulfatase activity